MKKLSILFLMALLAFSNNVNATDSSKDTVTKVVVVNMQKIVSESLVAKSIQEQIEKKRSQYQSDISKKDSDLRKLNQEISEQKAVLSQEKFEAKVKDFQVQAAKVQNEVHEKRSVLEKASSEAVSQIETTILSIISDLAKEQSFDLAINKMSTLYINDKLDISDEVLKRLNNKLPKLTLQINDPVSTAASSEDSSKSKDKTTKKK